MKWLYKACPKCGGDVYVSQEIDGPEFKCLQCAKTVYEADLRTLEHISKQPVSTGQNARRAA